MAIGGPTEETSVTRAVLRFVLSGLLAFGMVAAVAAFALRRAATSEAIADARRVTEVAGKGIVEPNLEPGIEEADPAAIRRLDRVVSRSVLTGDVVRVKLWTPEGQIVYSDEARLIGARFPLAEEELATIGSGEVEAEVSDLSSPENRFEREEGELLEVYFPIVAPSGRPLLFEAYLRFSSVAASGGEIWTTMAPGLIVSLAVLELIQLPLAWRLASSLRQRQREREGLLRAAIESSEVERRRIASDLHDGAVQELAGISMSLAGSADRARRRGDGELADSLTQAADGARRSVRELRTLLMDLYPPSLERAGLEAALRDLAAPLAAKDVKVDIDLSGAAALDPRDEALFFRSAQEALRNVLAHAQASEVAVTLTSDEQVSALEVRDDGRGISQGVLERRRAEGHVGLDLLRHLVEGAGGRLSVTSHDGQGTTLRAEVPRR